MTTIAVLTPIFDMMDTVEEAIASVLAQERPPDEFIIVDDGSTDRPNLTDAFHWGAVIERQRHKGTARALNAGMALATSDWVQLLAADDKLGNPRYLSELEAAADVAGERVGVISPRLQEFGLGSNEWIGQVTGPESFRSNPPVPGPSAIRREAWQQVGGFNPIFDETGGEDWDLWCALYEAGWGFVTVPSMTYLYRVDDRPRRYLDPDLNALLKQRIREQHPVLFSA